MSRHVFALAVLLAVLPARAADKEPVRIGFLTVNSGALAAGGRQMEDGLTLYLKEHGNKLAGRPFELITFDTAGQPATTRTGTKRAGGGGKGQAPTRPRGALEGAAYNTQGT